MRRLLVDRGDNRAPSNGRVWRNSEMYNEEVKKMSRSRHGNEVRLIHLTRRRRLADGIKLLCLGPREASLNQSIAAALLFGYPLNIG